MSSHVRRVALPAIALVVCCSTFAISALANNCADGGRSRPVEGGIGGTGLQPVGPDDDSGVGGTGISAAGDTGIIGTVTGFASICVGGTEIHYSADTPVHVDGQPVTPAQLAVGQVVEVVAAGSGSEMRARQIAVRHIVSGPVTRVDAERNAIEVIGQTIQLSPITRASGTDDERAAVAAAYPLHTFVQVSGMRRGDGVVVASRVARGAASEVVQLAGPVTQSDPTTLTIAGTPVRLESPVPLAVGEEVRVVGRWDGRAVVAGSIESIPRIPFDGRVARVDIEGFVHQTTATQLRVGAFSVEVPSGAPGLTPPSAPGARMRIQAIVQDRHVIVQRIGVMDDLPPLPQRNAPLGNSGKSNEWHDPVGASPPGQADVGEHGGPSGHDAPGTKPEGNLGMPGPPPELNDRPPGPQVPDRPPGAQIPDRPPAPQIPDRPAPPQMPDRPAPPQLPDRPIRPERPPLPFRPDTRGRP